MWPNLQKYQAKQGVKRRQKKENPPPHTHTCTHIHTQMEEQVQLAGCGPDREAHNVEGKVSQSIQEGLHSSGGQHQGQAVLISVLGLMAESGYRQGPCIWKAPDSIRA